MGRRVIPIIGATALLAALLLAVAACENPLLGTVQQIYTSFHSKLVQANFSSSNAKQYIVSSITVDFTDQSIGDISSYSWNFGDPGLYNTSTLPNPSHTYWTEGYYTVSLTVTGPDGSSTETKEDFVVAYGDDPMVNIALPNHNDDVTGTVEIQASADFIFPIINVQFYINNEASPRYTDSTAPYSYTWNTSSETENTAIPLKAVVNVDGNSAVDDDTDVFVDNTPPSVDLTAPSAGGVSGSVALAANATDTPGSGMDRVEFYVDGSRRYTDYTPTVTDEYSYTWNARFYPEGSSHTLMARGFDEVGLFSNDSTGVTINNYDDIIQHEPLDLSIEGINNKISVDASLIDDVVVVASEDSGKGRILLSVYTADGTTLYKQYVVVTGEKFKPTNPVVAFASGRIYLAFLQDTGGDGRKDIVMLSSEYPDISWEEYWFSDNPDPTGLALDVRGNTLGLLFDVGRDLHIACTKDISKPIETVKSVIPYAYARDLSLTAYGGIGYFSWVNRSDELMFAPADLGSGDLLKEAQRLATDVRGYSSTAVDPGGKMVGVAFVDRYANPMVMLADRVELKFNPVERIADYGDCAYTSLEIGVESLRLAYTSEKYGLRLSASQVGKNWITYPVPPEGAFAYVSTALDDNLWVHIGYYDVKAGQQRFAVMPFNW
jgi:PKD repeat protein